MTQPEAWVAYVGPIQFPWGQPGSRRVHGVARSLATGGHHVVVVSGEEGPEAVTSLEDIGGPGSVSYVGVGKLPAGGSLLARAAQVFLHWGQKTVDWLEAQQSRPSHVIVYGGGAPYMLRLRRWCALNRVPIIADIVEWYHPRQMRGGRFGPAHLSAKLALRYHYPRCDGVIAISSFLADHYRARGSKVVQVPPTMDTRDITVSTSPLPPGPEPLSLLYAGTPGRKDLLAAIVSAVDRVRREGGPCDLRIIGPSAAQVRDLLRGAPIPDGVWALGRLPQPDLPSVLQDVDFTVLLRRPERFAHAGFPTKFCESLASGTPVIANLTSDLGRYLRDGQEGLVCRDHTVQALAETLWRAIRLGGQDGCSCGTRPGHAQRSHSTFATIRRRSARSLTR